MKIAQFIAIAVLGFSAVATVRADDAAVPATSAAQSSAADHQNGAAPQAPAGRQPGHLLDHGPRALSTPWVNQQIQLHEQQKRQAQAAAAAGLQVVRSN